VTGTPRKSLLTARIGAAGQPNHHADQARVPWWSFTKTALAAAALKLVARGRLALDDQIEGRRYTLRQLLQHQAGVPDYGGLASYHRAVADRQKPWDVDELVMRVAADRLDFEPGRGWRYSNVGYLFVRQIIERTTGQDIGSALRYLVFDALELSSVRIVATARELAETAWGNHNNYDPGWVYHGLLAGTPADATHFLHRLMSGGVLPAALLSEMTTCHPLGGALPGRPWETTGYGLGLMIGGMTSAGLATGHSGTGPGSVSAVYHFGDRKTPCTVAAFALADTEGVAENEVARLAGPP
jgi:D-alanyl-D-alanine carboxypeptidase